MVKFSTSSEDLDEYYKQFPDIEVKLNGEVPHVSSYVYAFRQFLGAVGFGQGTIDEYVPECYPNDL